jgi:hypothetical protein
VISLPSEECHVSHNPEKTHQEKGSETLPFFSSSAQCSILTPILKKSYKKKFVKRSLHHVSGIIIMTLPKRRKQR